MKRPSPPESVAAAITKVRMAAAHEGLAEMIVTVGYDSGGHTDVALDRHASEALLELCSAANPDQLIGQNWQHVRDALSKSYNRFQ
ncbi:MAG: hypothetical protein AB8B93_20760 [Pseudomonadales bacterium]